MSKPKLRRWVCVRCGSGKLAPSRPRRNDVRRYCLPCSEAIGVLIERVCPAKLNEAARRAERKRRARENRVLREAQEIVRDRFDNDEEIA